MWVLLLLSSALAQPTKPMWPVEFDSPFGLTNLGPLSPLLNVTSHFYYNWDQLQSQVIDYPVRCIPGLEPSGEDYPCKLYFNPQGTYMSQPALNLPCCSYFPGVGAVPPTFLQGFTFNSTQNAADYYGVVHECNYWTGSGFAYWTDATTGFDVFFQDGDTGTYWGWGDFNDQPQSKSIFTLPGSNGECSQPCPGSQTAARQQEIWKTLTTFVPLIKFSSKLR